MIKKEVCNKWYGYISWSDRLFCEPYKGEDVKEQNNKDKIKELIDQIHSKEKEIKKLQDDISRIETEIVRLCLEEQNNELGN